MPNRSSMTSPSVVGIGGPLYSHQTLNRPLNNNGALNNNERPTTVLYTPLGVNPNVAVKFSETPAGGGGVGGSKNQPTYSTVNKQNADKAVVGDSNKAKMSNFGTHV